MNGQKIANLLTILFLIGGLVLVGFFMVVNWSTFTQELSHGGTTITGGIVAFVVTFLVLILVTFVISFLKWILNREQKVEIEKKNLAGKSKAEKSTHKKVTGSVEENHELIAVLTAAIHASNKMIAPHDTFKIFKVREMITSSSSWRIFSKDDLSGVGG